MSTLFSGELEDRDKLKINYFMSTPFSGELEDRGSVTDEKLIILCRLYVDTFLHYSRNSALFMEFVLG